MGSAEEFPQDVLELQAYFAPSRPGQMIRAVPGAGLDIPIWLLGSSLYSAELAARLGLPFAFASHFAPDYLLQALEAYRRNFRPSRSLDVPYAMPALNAIAADTDEEARRLFTSAQQQFINLRRGVPGRLQSPDEVNDAEWTPEDRQSLGRVLRYAVVGSIETVRTGLEQFIELTGADELMVTSQVFDHQARLRSFQLVAEARKATTQAG
jgi:luciferase family oxidoreductase group 1